MSIEVTRLLRLWRDGDTQAAEELAPLIYPELRRLAAVHVRREGGGVEIQPTELVHEVYLRLMGQNHPLWESREHFYSVASRIMRQVLVDQARQFHSVKRSGGVRVTLDPTQGFTEEHSLDLLRLEQALAELERMDARKARIVEQHHFGGLSAEEIAEIHGVSAITIRRDLRIASAWLRRWFLH